MEIEKAQIATIPELLRRLETVKTLYWLLTKAEADEDYLNYLAKLYAVNPQTLRLEDITIPVAQLFQGQSLIPLVETEGETEQTLQEQGYDPEQFKDKLTLEGDFLYIPEIANQDLWVGGYWQALNKLISQTLFGKDDEITGFIFPNQ
jgi:hypothetical protein